MENSNPSENPSENLNQSENPSENLNQSENPSENLNPSENPSDNPNPSENPIESKTTSIGNRFQGALGTLTEFAKNNGEIFKFGAVCGGMALAGLSIRSMVYKKPITHSRPPLKVWSKYLAIDPNVCEAFSDLGVYRDISQTTFDDAVEYTGRILLRAFVLSNRGPIPLISSADGTLSLQDYMHVTVLLSTLAGIALRSNNARAEVEIRRHAQRIQSIISGHAFQVQDMCTNAPLTYLTV